MEMLAKNLLFKFYHEHILLKLIPKSYPQKCEKTKEVSLEFWHHRMELNCGLTRGYFRGILHNVVFTIHILFY